MKLSAKIRKGATLSDPTRGVYITADLTREHPPCCCALGAAAIADLDPSTDPTLLEMEVSERADAIRKQLLNYRTPPAFLAALGERHRAAMRLTDDHTGLTLGPSIIAAHDTYEGDEDPRLVVAGALEACGL